MPEAPFAVAGIRPDIPAYAAEVLDRELRSSVRERKGGRKSVGQGPVSGDARIPSAAAHARLTHSSDPGSAPHHVLDSGAPLRQPGRKLLAALAIAVLIVSIGILLFIPPPSPPMEPPVLPQPTRVPEGVPATPEAPAVTAPGSGGDAGARVAAPVGERPRLVRPDAGPATTTPLPTPGRLYISATPWGQLRIDGVLIGNTPRSDYPIEPGLHVIRIERTGFAPFEREIEVESGQEIRLTGITLAPERP